MADRSSENLSVRGVLKVMKNDSDVFPKHLQDAVGKPKLETVDAMVASTSSCILVDESHFV